MLTNSQARDSNNTKAHEASSGTKATLHSITKVSGFQDKCSAGNNENNQLKYKSKTSLSSHISSLEREVNGCLFCISPHSNPHKLVETNAIIAFPSS